MLALAPGTKTAMPSRYQARGRDFATLMTSSKSIVQNGGEGFLSPKFPVARIPCLAPTFLSRNDIFCARFAQQVFLEGSGWKTMSRAQVPNDSGILQSGPSKVGGARG